MRFRRRLTSVAATMALVTGLLVAMALPASAGTWFTSIDDFRFSPGTLTVKAGDTVVWDHDGRIAHTVTSADGSFDSGTMYGGDTFVRTFPRPGEFDYFCNLHPWMRGSINVQSKNAVTAAPATSTVTQATAWSKQLPDGSASTAMIGRDDVFADALSSGPAQAALGAPLLLTDPAALSPETRAELTRLGVKRAMILGGTGAVSSAVENQIKAMGITTERLAGASRIDTAIAVAERVMPGADSAILARAFGSGSDPSRAFADAIGAGAAGGNLGAPVVLTETASLNDQTKAYLMRNGIGRVYIAGGTAAISEAVETSLSDMGMEVIRVAGPGRTETSLMWAFQTHPTSLTPLDTDGPKRFLVVDATAADSWASGLAASLHAAGDGLVVAATGVTPEMQYFAIEMKPRIICGPNIAADDCELLSSASNTPSQFDPSASPIAVLSGDGSPSGDGDPNALSTVINLFPTTDAGTVCAVAPVFFQEPITAAHVHRVSDGTVVFPIGSDIELGGNMVGCTTGITPADVSAVFSNPTAYYVNIHTESFPGGAIAGTIFFADFLHVSDATGDQEVPAVDAEGVAITFVTGREDTSEICTQSFAFGLSGDATAAHIHDGDRGVSGPPVVTMPPIITLGPGFATGTGCTAATPAVYAGVRDDPGGHYVNVHTEANPNGELRGELVPLG